MHDKEAQYKLLSLAAEGREDAKEELIRNNLGLVKSIAYKFMGYGYEWEDLVQVGCIGLVKAIERFDMSFDVMFSTYAMPLIIGEIKRYIRDDGRLKVSRETKTGIIKMKAVRERLTKEMGRSPKLSELCQALETESQTVIMLMEAEQCLNSIGSLDDPDNFEREEKDPTNTCGDEEQINRILLKSIIEKLPPRERQIIIFRYYKDMTQTEIAEILGISQVHVSRLEKKILAKIGSSFGQDKRQECQAGS